MAADHITVNEEADESQIYELPELLPPEPKKNRSPRRPEVVKDMKRKRRHHFNIFITVLAVFSLLLALITLIIFLVHYSSYQPLETQQNIDNEALKLLLNKSNEEVLSQESKLESEFEKAQLLIQTIQEQLNISNQQNQENISEIREQVNNSSQQNEGRVIELQEKLSISNQQNEEKLFDLREQLNNSSQQNEERVIKLQEAIEDYVQDLKRRLDNTDYEIQKLSSDLRSHVWSVEQLFTKILKVPVFVGGLRKVAEIDMTDPTQQCPDGFKQINRTEPPLRTCGRPDDRSRGCVPTIFPVNGIEYSRVCGRIVAYQIGTPSGFGPPLSSSIDRDYVAGISLTHGQPRQHIWSFANARGEGFTSEVCPCVSGNTDIVPEFVGSDYFCDSAIRGTNVTNGVFYPNDPLWDGQGCGSRSTCCEFNNPPWFCKQLPQPTTDDIEMRLCENSFNVVDDSPFELVELFVN